MSDKTPQAKFDRQLMEFPCDFPLKVFGLNEPGFEPLVLDLLRLHCPPSCTFQIGRNKSKKGKYQSLTIEFVAHSRQQLDDIYQSLSNSDQVVMTL